MSPPPTVTPRQKTSFPRVSGDEPAAVVSYPSMLKFSPRERG